MTGNLNQSRFNLVEQQIRTWEVLDERVLALYYQVPREDFVADAALRDLAFADAALPISEGQFMLPPKLEARMLQALEIKGDEKALHIGCGSGFFAALLSRLAAEVITVDIFPSLAAAAQKRLATHGADNIAVRVGDGARGFSQDAPYDLIALTGSTPILAREFLAQLKTGGRIIAVVGDAPAMTLRLIRKFDDDVFDSADILETEIPPLINAPAPPRFSF
jgi:protein-L-isoaspartate(D-aspartate) O-methyltransferase